MNLNKYNDYIEGKKFSNALPVKTGENTSKSRLELIQALVKGKAVIHVGCVDHNPTFIESKLKKDRWLHKLISDSASRCLGIDIDAIGIDYLRTRLGYEDLIAGDMFDPVIAKEITTQKWDYMIIGELLEHTANPVDFLKQIKSLYGSSVSTIIVTVPNAFSLNNIYYSFKDTEMVNSDHYYWFTPYTLTRVVHRAGMKTEELYLCSYFRKNRLGIKHKICNPLKSLREMLRSFLLRRHPIVNECIVAVIRG